MFSRHIEPYLLRLSESYPVVTVTGPRQSGKTTLVKKCFPSYNYISLEAPHIRNMATDDPIGFLKNFKPPIIFDEIQRVPQLLSYIQTVVDENNLSGQYILTGSHQPLLQQGVTQSLAGRTGLLRLLPFSISELQKSNILSDNDQYIFNGFMPRLYDNTNLTPNDLYRDYFATYIEKDVSLILNIKHKRNFENFIQLLAARVGQVVNLSSISNQLGVSSQTLSNWLSVPESSFIIFRLPCYYENFNKRIIKNYKIYFTEVGLARWLLGINNVKDIKLSPFFGGLFENMVVIDLLKTRLNMGERDKLYFFRDTGGFEIDLIYEKSVNELVPIEIKSSATWNKDFVKNLIKAKSLSEKFTNGFVIYSGEDIENINGRQALNFVNAKNCVM